MYFQRLSAKVVTQRCPGQFIRKVRVQVEPIVPWVDAIQGFVQSDQSQAVSGQNIITQSILMYASVPLVGQSILVVTIQYVLYIFQGQVRLIPGVSLHTYTAPG